MSFGAFGLLSLLCFVPLAAIGWWWLWRARRLDWIRVGATVEGERAGLGWSRALLALALLLIGVAAARPQWSDGEQALAQSERALMIALDVSLSMAAEDVGDGGGGVVSRFRAAQSEIRRLIDAHRGDQVGLAIFAGDAFLRFPLTRDHEAALAVLEALQPGEALVSPGSDISAAISLSAETIRRASDVDAGRDLAGAIVVISDGESHLGDAALAARVAFESGLRVYGVGVGSSEGARIPLLGAIEWKLDPRDGEPVVTRLEDAELRQIAAAGGGRYVELSAPGAMSPINADLAALDLARPVEVVETARAEQFQWFVVAAIAALLLSIAVRSVRTPRLLSLAGLSALLLAVGASSACGGSDVAQLNRDAIGHYELGEYEQALQTWREAQRQSLRAEASADPLLNLNVARALHQLGQYERAETEALAALRSDQSAIRARAWLLAGQHRFAREDLLGARDAFVESLRESPSLHEAKVNLEIVNRLLAEVSEPPPPEPESGEQAGTDSGGEPSGGGQDAGLGAASQESGGAERSSTEGQERMPAPTFAEETTPAERRVAAEAELQDALEELPLEFASLEQALVVLDAMRAVPGEGLAAGRGAADPSALDW